MFRLIRLGLARLGAHPMRAALVVLTLAVGTAVVALAFSLRSSLARLERTLVSDQGTRVVIANGSTDANGVWEWEMPPRFVQADGPEIQAQIPEVLSVTPYQEHRWPSVLAGGRSWQVRSTAGVGAGYARIMDLEMIAGSFFTDQDAATGGRVAVLSESAARTMFGGVEQALGQDIEASTGMVFMAVEADSQGAVDTAAMPVEMKERYRVTGVYRDPARLKRQTYGIPEVLIPHTAAFPIGMMRDIPLRSFVALVDESRPGVIQSAVQAVMDSTYGEGVQVQIWEGDPGRPLAPGSPDPRDAIRSFSTVVGILAVAILLLSGFGVFSALMAEGADSGRETGILRALGAGVGTLRTLVVIRAAVLGLIGGLLGAAGALLLRGALWGVLGQLMSGMGLGMEDVVRTAASPLAVPAAVLSAVAAASLFGLLPAGLAGRASIVESIRES